MKYNLERSIRLENQPKQESLYPWALQEIGEDEEQIGEDQIPYDLLVLFEATELTLHEGHVAESEYDSGRTWLRAKLTPAKGERWRRPSYSMFGTEREIGSIQLFVHRIESTEEEKPANSIRVSGSPSYTSSDPLFGGTEDDFIQFDLGLSSDEYDRIANKVAKNEIDYVSFSCRAEGFYSEWTPDGDVLEYKILCADLREQTVELPENCEIKFPRLGEVRDASLSVQKTSYPRITVEQLQRDVAGEEELEEWDEPNVPAPPANLRWVEPVLSELKLLKTLIGAVLAILILTFFLK